MFDPKNGKSRGKNYKDVTVNAGGGFEFTLDPQLTGDVENAIEFMRKLAQSEVVEQVFVRHVFRYFMGRNETLGDAETLRRAHAAYRENRGSMNALIVSLLSSESFFISRSSKRNPVCRKTCNFGQRIVILNLTIQLFLGSFQDVATTPRFAKGH